MKHTIGFVNFDPADHAIHGMLIDHKSGYLTLGNVSDEIKKRTDSHEKLVESMKT